MSPCQLCHNLVKDDISGHRLSLDFTPDCLQQSVALHECQSCAILLNGISLMQDNTWSFAAHVSRVYGYGLATGLDTLTLEVYFVDDRPRLTFELFYGELSDPTAMPWRAIRPRTLISGDPLSQRAMQWVKSRVDICFESHATCRLPMELPFPKRILALDRISGGGISVKVMEVENNASLGIYAALSHCWGAKLPCVMSKDNRTNRLCGIPWTELPQTFQDAIRYCLELGISYLWIDALCIIQDDPEDWQIQSAKMASIYQNSYITLAATSSDCGSSGCFQQRSVAYKERSLEVPYAGTQVYQILIRQRVSHWTVPPTSLSKRENPLLSRGWVLQERILSPRVLHFCKQELVWECGQETVCECGSIPKTQNLKLQFALAARFGGIEESPQSEQGDEGFSASQINSSHLIGFDSAQESGARREAINQWHRIVEQYSALDLTKDRDGLPALSGLAERMAPFLSDYLAGLWRRSFLFDLCWKIDKLVYVRQTPVEYRGPSWSWVSTKATVSFWTQEETTPRLTVAEPDQRDRRHRTATSRPSSSVQGSRSQAFRNQRMPTPDIISCTVDRYGILYIWRDLIGSLGCRRLPKRVESMGRANAHPEFGCATQLPSGSGAWG